MPLNKPLQILPRAVPALLSLISLHLAQRPVLLRILPRLMRQLMDGAVPRRQHGDVLLRVREPVVG